MLLVPGMLTDEHLCGRQLLPLLLLLLLQACQQSPGAAALPTPPSWKPLVRWA
jgi:hypothetical protein